MNRGKFLRTEKVQRYLRIQNGSKCNVQSQCFTVRFQIVLLFGSDATFTHYVNTLLNIICTKTLQSPAGRSTHYVNNTLFIIAQYSVGKVTLCQQHLVHHCSVFHRLGHTLGRQHLVHYCSALHRLGHIMSTTPCSSLLSLP